MKRRLPSLAFGLIIVSAPYCHAAYDSWFTVTGHPDGNSHTAQVLHDTSWPTAGIASFINPPGVQAIYVDGFASGQEGWAQEVIELAYAVAVAKEAYQTSTFPAYIITNNTGAAPIRPDQWTRERRTDYQGNQFTSHCLKHMTITGAWWYDYDALSSFQSRKTAYFSALWQTALQPARDASTITDLQRLSALRQEISFRSAEWK